MTKELHVFDIDKTSYELFHLETQAAVAQRLSNLKETGNSGEDSLFNISFEPVYTKGTNKYANKIVKETDIPIFQSTRAGGVTYHGPGQIAIQLIVDLRNVYWSNYTICKFLQQVVCDVLNERLTKSEYTAKTVDNMPGVYIFDGHKNNLGKVSSIGMNNTNSILTKGISLNYNVDLSVYDNIVMCGLKDMGACNIVDYMDVPREELTVDIIERIKAKYKMVLKPELDFTA